MAVPLKWNTLDQAAKWLSEKTEEFWNTTKILDFAIDQCQPDDIVDDHKYPSYIRTILPEAIGDSLTGVSLLMGNSQENYVSEGIQLGGKKIRTTFVFRDNLIELLSTGKTSIRYVYDDSQNEFLHLKRDETGPITIYCEDRSLFINLDVYPSKHPSIPIIDITLEGLGIRDEDLKQLLRDYLALSAQEFAIKDKPLHETSATSKPVALRQSQIDKATFQGIATAMWEKNPNLTQSEIIDSEKMEFYRLTYTGKNTLRNWILKVDPRPQQSRRGRPKKIPATSGNDIS